MVIIWGIGGGGGGGAELATLTRIDDSAEEEPPLPEAPAELAPVLPVFVIGIVIVIIIEAGAGGGGGGGGAAAVILSLAVAATNAAGGGAGGAGGTTCVAVAPPPLARCSGFIEDVPAAVNEEELEWDRWRGLGPEPPRPGAVEGEEEEAPDDVAVVTPSALLGALRRRILGDPAGPDGTLEDMIDDDVLVFIVDDTGGGEGAAGMTGVMAGMLGSVVMIEEGDVARGGVDEGGDFLFIPQSLLLLDEKKGV